MHLRLILTLSCVILVLTSICMLFSEQIFADNSPTIDATRNIDGTVTFTVKTATYNGGYAPRNAGVIWITNSQNQFVKTIKVWAQPYRYTLVRWIANSGSNTTAAITGASLNTHQLHTVTWNAKDYQGNTVPDGDYTFNVEFTEHNATSSNMGKYKTLSFAKGSTPINETYPNETYFRNLSLIWQPIITDGVISGTIKNSSDVPIQGATIIVGSITATSSVTGSYNIQIAPGTYDVYCSVAGYQEQTQSGITVLSEQTTSLDFIMNAVSNDDHHSVPPAFALDTNVPNPFKIDTAINYTIAKNSHVSLRIYNLKGQLIRELVNASQSTGRHHINWDGTLSNGKKANSGKYIYTLSVDGQETSKTLTLVK